MEWDVLFTDEFGTWWESLDADEQADVDAYVVLLQKFGASLRFPYTSGVQSSAHDQMRELRVQHRGRPYRVLYAFDPTRSALLLIGGDKTGDDRWYETYVPIADRLYSEHLAALARERKGQDQREAKEFQRTTGRNDGRGSRQKRRKSKNSHTRHGS